ncbi:Uncharacterised protein [Vibrio cholerae]|nr:Uncharacterised protein [Vibrio cholerae]
MTYTQERVRECDTSDSGCVVYFLTSDWIFRTIRVARR